jgi:hypothetical protein
MSDPDLDPLNADPQHRVLVTLRGRHQNGMSDPELDPLNADPQHRVLVTLRGRHQNGMSDPELDPLKKRCGSTTLGSIVTWRGRLDCRSLV